MGTLTSGSGLPSVGGRASVVACASEGGSYETALVGRMRRQRCVGKDGCPSGGRHGVVEVTQEWLCVRKGAMRRGG